MEYFFAFLIIWVCAAPIIAHVIVFVIQLIPILFEFFFTCLFVAGAFFGRLTLKALKWTFKALVWIAVRVWRGAVLAFEFALIFAQELRGAPEDDGVFDDEDGEDTDDEIDVYDAALAALGLEPGFTKAALRSAYRQMMKRVHPDAPGGSTQAAQGVNEAYALLMQHHGWT